MRNLREVKRINAIYLRVLEGEGEDENPYREEEYVYFDDEDELFVIEHDSNMLKRVKAKEEDE